MAESPSDVRLTMEPLDRERVSIDAFLGDVLILAGAVAPRGRKSRKMFLDQLASKIDINTDELDERIMLDGAELLRPPESESEQSQVAEELLKGMDPTVVEEATARLRSDGLMEFVIESRRYVGIVGEEQLFALLYLGGISRQLDTPVNLILQGASAAGKSFPIRRAARFVPPEAKVETTTFSQNSMFYVPSNFFEHKLVCAGERKRVADESEQTMRQVLRELMSDGEVSKLVAIKSGNDITTKHFHVRGPIAYQESTTLDELFCEDANRVLLVHPDESQDQTQAILAELCRREQHTAEYDGETSQHVINVHHAMQRLIKPRQTVFPGAPGLLEGLPMGNLEARRLYPHLLNVAKASALLHQYQRETDDYGRLVVTQGDADLARVLVQHIVLERLRGDLSKATRSFLDWLSWTDGNFTRQEIVVRGSADGVTSGQINHHLPKLVASGYVLVISDRIGSKGAKYQLATNR